MLPHSYGIVDNYAQGKTMTVMIILGARVNCFCNDSYTAILHLIIQRFGSRKQLSTDIPIRTVVGVLHLWLESYTYKEDITVKGIYNEVSSNILQQSR